MNPKKMQALMKQMGIKSEEMPCSRAVFEKEDGSKIVVENPAVTKIEMKGQVTFQVMGEVKEEKTVDAQKGDVEIIMEQTGAPKEKAEAALARGAFDEAERLAGKAKESAIIAVGEQKK